MHPGTATERDWNEERQIHLRAPLQTPRLKASHVKLLGWSKSASEGPGKHATEDTSRPDVCPVACKHPQRPQRVAHKLRQERHVYSRQTPHAICFVFQRRGGGDCAGGVHKLNGRTSERHRRAAEKQKNHSGKHVRPSWSNARETVINPSLILLSTP